MLFVFDLGVDERLHQRSSCWLGSIWINISRASSSCSTLPCSSFAELHACCTCSAYFLIFILFDLTYIRDNLKMNFPSKILIVFGLASRYLCEHMLFQLFHYMLLEIWLYFWILHFCWFLQDIWWQLLVEIPNVPTLKTFQMFSKCFRRLAVVFKKMPNIRISDRMEIIGG